MPQNVHHSIRWSKQWPWLESEILNVDERLELLEELRKKKVDQKNLRSDKKSITSPKKKLIDTSDVGRCKKGERNAAKQRRSSGMHDSNHASHDAAAVNRPSRKWKALGLVNKSTTSDHTNQIQCAQVNNQ